MTILRTRIEPRLLAAIAAIASSAWLFIETAEEVLEGATRSIDTAILLAFRSPGAPTDPLGPKWFEEFARDISGLGGSGVLTLIVAASAVFLWLAGKHRTVLFVLASTLGGALATTLLKAGFGRPRPDLVPHGSYVTSASFPSGHAMMSAVVYLTLAALVARLIPQRWLKLYVLAVATVLSGLIGLSRVYLGVHWPSDVLAGWVAGAAWALGCWTVAQLGHLDNGAGR